MNQKKVNIALVLVILIGGMVGFFFFGIFIKPLDQHTKDLVNLISTIVVMAIIVIQSLLIRKAGLEQQKKYYMIGFYSILVILFAIIVFSYFGFLK